MEVARMPAAEVRQRLSGPGLDLRTGSLTLRIRSSISRVAEGIRQLYADFPVADGGGFVDFQCQIRAPHGVRRFYRRQVCFLFEHREVFRPLPYAQAFPMLEWGMNWCMATQIRHQLVLHAAALERDGRALVLTGPPGSGKSTLCAALTQRGWRLLSDETTLLDPETGCVTGPVRPISLKNASVEAIRAFAPHAWLSAPCHDTLKGTVVHMRPPPESVTRMTESALPGWVIFPRYRAGAATRWRIRSPGRVLLGLAANAFNYPVLGRRAFHALVDVAEQVDAWDLTYSDLEQVVGDIDAQTA